MVKVKKIIINNVDSTINFGKLLIQDLSGTVNIGTTYEDDSSDIIQKKVKEKLGNQ